MTPAQAEWIKAAIAPSGLQDIEDIERAIASGEMHFWPGENCAAVTQFLIYPKMKVLAVVAVGGVKGLALSELMNDLEPELCKFAAANDCKRVMGCGIHETWRPVCEKHGYYHQWTIMSKDLP